MVIHFAPVNSNTAALFSVPPLLVAAALSIKLIHLEMFDLLFGLWLTMYAVTGFTGHRFMPAKLNWVNSYYLVAGLSMLLIPGMAFTASLVAGMIYFIGEAMAGTVLHLDHTREL